MFDILIMLFFFLDAVIIHLLVCRKHAGKGLLLMPFVGIAFVNLFLMGLVFWFLGKTSSSGVTSLWSVRLPISAAGIYMLLIPAYLVFYFSTQQMSPTKKILLMLDKQGPLKMSDLSKHFTDEEFILPRIKELIGIQCLVEHNGWYVITPQGSGMANVYGIFQKILGRSKGG